MASTFTDSPLNLHDISVKIIGIIPILQMRNRLATNLVLDALAAKAKQCSESVYSNPFISMVSVTCGQLRSENTKFPQPSTLSVPDIQPSTSSWLNDPGSPETDDPPSEVSSEGQ